MNCVRRMTDDLFYIGGSDRRLAKFENLFPLPYGVSYNSYLILDQKTVVLDAVDHAVAELFLENLAAGLQGRPARERDDQLGFGVKQTCLAVCKPGHLCTGKCTLHLAASCTVHACQQTGAHSCV